MGRSHAWLPRGTELIEPRPRNWGDNLTLVGAIRIDEWLALGTHWGAMTAGRFVTWVRRRLVRRLRRGDVVVMDNLAAHKARQVRDLIEAAGATVRYLPPYSHDFNPIDAAWTLIKK
ncbi:MAG: transposase, partial [Vicinamibacterales bacterium]